MEQAGSSINLKNTEDSISVKIVCFRQNFQQILEKLTHDVSKGLVWHTQTDDEDDAAKSEKFYECRKKTIRSYQNFSLNSPYKTCSTWLQALTHYE